VAGSLLILAGLNTRQTGREQGHPNKCQPQTLVGREVAHRMPDGQCKQSDGISQTGRYITSKTQWDKAMESYVNIKQMWVYENLMNMPNVKRLRGGAGICFPARMFFVFHFEFVEPKFKCLPVSVTKFPPEVNK